MKEREKEEGKEARRREKKMRGERKGNCERVSATMEICTAL